MTRIVNVRYRRARHALVTACAIAALTACGTTNDEAAPSLSSATSSQPTTAVPPTVTAVDPADFAMETRDGVEWVSPSRNIYCHITEGEFSSGCQAADAPVPDGANCTNPTFTVDQLSKGFFMSPNKATPNCFNQGVFGGDPDQILPYDHSISYNGFTCTSREDAMMCDAGGGHGFVLSMQEARAY